MREHLADIIDRSPWYARKFSVPGFDPNDLMTWEDLTKLPTTTKADLSQHNAEFLSIPKERIVEYITTSGSLGKPVPFFLSEKDLDRLARNEAASLSLAGVTSQDVVQITTTLDKQFMAGIAYWLGLRKIGASIVRSGPGNVQSQWETARRSGTTVLISVPSFLLRMLTGSSAPPPSTLRKVICIGEPIATEFGKRNLLAERILEHCDLELHGTYASTEMATAFTEPRSFEGHVAPQELILTEILDEEGRAVEEGSPGEVVVTPWGVDAMPLLRFRTGDICTWRSETTTNGNYRELLGPILGRKEQRMKVNGTTLYPQQIIDALNGATSVNDHAIVRERDEFDLDKVRVLIDLPYAELEQISEFLHSRLRVRLPVEQATPAEIRTLTNDPGKRKPAIFVDRINDPRT